jgi:hypothetical protein
MELVDSRSPKDLDHAASHAIDVCQLALLRQDNWSRYFSGPSAGGGSIACGLTALAEFKTASSFGDKPYKDRILREFCKLEELKVDNSGWGPHNAEAPNQFSWVHITCLAMRAYRLHGQMERPGYACALEWLKRIAGFERVRSDSGTEIQNWDDLRCALGIEELAASARGAEFHKKLKCISSLKIKRIIRRREDLELRDMATLSRLLDAYSSTCPDYGSSVGGGANFRIKALKRILPLINSFEDAIPAVQEVVDPLASEISTGVEAIATGRLYRPDNWAHLSEERALVALLRLGHPVLSDEVYNRVKNILKRQFQSGKWAGLWWSGLNPGIPSVFACSEAIEALRLFRLSLKKSVPVIEITGDVAQEAFIVETRSTWQFMPRTHNLYNEPGLGSWIPRGGGAILTAQYMESHAFVALEPRLVRWKEAALGDWSPPAGSVKGIDTYDRQIYGIGLVGEDTWRVTSSLLRQRCKWPDLTPPEDRSQLVNKPDWLIMDDFKPISEEGKEFSFEFTPAQAPLIVKTTRLRRILLGAIARKGVTIIVVDLMQFLASEGVHYYSWENVVKAVHERLTAATKSARAPLGICLVGGRAGCLYFWTEGSAGQPQWRGKLWWDVSGTRAALERAEEGWFAGSHNLFVSELVRALYYSGCSPGNAIGPAALMPAVGVAWDVVRVTIQAGIDVPGVLKYSSQSEPFDISGWAFRPRLDLLGDLVSRRRAEIEICENGELPPDQDALMTALEVLTRGTGVLQGTPIPSQEINSDRKVQLRPVLILGDLLAVDSPTVEELGYLVELVQDYLKRPQSARLLSIGVFGRPGSGKSFAVRQIAKATLGNRAKFLEFNLSQFKEPAHILDAFQRIQSASLEGGFPVVFWDEFDANDYDWVKNFLAPLQDRQFSIAGTVHHLPQSIFVFAGGVTHSEAEFRTKVADGKYLSAKLPDFESRIKAYLTVRSIVPKKDGRLSDVDEYYSVLVTRAMLVRSMLRTHVPRALRIEKKAAIALLICYDYEVARTLERVFERGTFTGLDVIALRSLHSDDREALIEKFNEWERELTDDERKHWQEIGDLLDIYW